ncbi:Tim44-like domain-containing protein [Herbaspirillum sp. RTI4]|uniref:Tim44 domain-containing protein n=1 Tax=Herbaspirillum sp. RTI4 TaxID=3048640 RepID=UPI002AB478F0|nr:Tim44-like domain-containing protein [Herbaspirillum sp. RTI4]MDY7576813.1 Tim44-like domain-containing protein [Herbaspirillum sp. RTI4]MEA9981409.1 Tim44-like domain-containing protein [Herbaspirillum sp. RTI4]
MKKVFVAFVIAALTLTAGIGSAEARRLGGGGSFGKQSSMQRSAPASAPAAKPAAPAATPQGMPPKPASPWKGILGGALLGLGLGAMLSHFGMGGALGSMISTLLMVALLGFAAMFIYRMFRRKTEGEQAQPAYATRAPGDFLANTEPFPNTPMARQAAPEIGSGIAGADAASGIGGASTLGAPADFDTTGFLRHAKTYFIRLQAAWDKADIEDIREFSSPEMFAELRLQIQERGATSNHTDVMTLDAQLQGIETIGGEYLASVKFSGMIKEDLNVSAEPFAEIWNLSKPVSGNGGWVLAGIQQLG